MSTQDVLAEQFEQNRPRLCAVAYRMLGSPGVADDAVQEAWLRLSRLSAGEGSSTSAVGLRPLSLACLLTCCASREDDGKYSLDVQATAPRLPAGDAGDPEEQALLADSIGPAMLLVLDTLPPAERLAFVLHDMFGVSFAEIAPIVGRSPEAARQLASRGRRRVRGAVTAVRHGPGPAARGGGGLSRRRPGRRLRGAHEVARSRRSDARRCCGSGARLTGGGARGPRRCRDVLRACARRQAGAYRWCAGAAWAPGGKPRVAFAFTLRDGVVEAIDLLADEGRLGRAGIVILDD